MHDETAPSDLTASQEPSLADRAEARIAKAESDLAVAKSKLETASQEAVQAKGRYDELHRLTTALNPLAPLIRDEVNARERFWRQSEERRAKLTDSVDVASNELKSVYLARKQLKQIGLYRQDEMAPATAAVQAAAPAPPHDGLTAK